MRILFFGNKDTGLYNARKELIEALVQKGYEVFASVPEGSRIPSLEQLGCHVIETEISRHGMNPFQDLKLLQKYRKILQDLKPDIVFTYTIKPNIYGGMACSSLKIPYVTNITGLGTAVENKGILQFLTCGLYKYGLRQVQTVFFQNAENEEFFVKKKIALGKHKLLPGSGVNLQFYMPTPYPEGETLNFVYIGRVMKAKGIDQYLEAAEYIQKNHSETRFHICGPCEDEYKEIIKKKEKDGTVIYHGYVKDMRSIYTKMHCVILPSFYPEGMSNVLLEASASARPIITTDRSGCREAIDDGINGFIVKQKSSQDLIEKIEKFIALPFNQKKKMGLAGRAKAEQKFDRQIVVKAYLQEVDSVKEKS